MNYRCYTFLYNNSDCHYELIVAVTIVLLNLYVAVGISCRIPHFVLSIHFLDVATSICVEVDSQAPHELPFYDKAFGR